MEVRKNSWHHKLYEFGYRAKGFVPTETNLCKYFWGVAWGIFVASLLSTVALVVVYGLGYMFYNYSVISFIVLGAIGAIVGLCYLLILVYERWEDKRYAAKYQNPEPGLIRSYLKAKKDRVCPRITFLSENQFADAPETKQEESP